MRYTTIEKSEEAIKDYLNELSDSDLVSLHNQFCQNNNDSDSEIFSNDEDFFETFFDGKVMDAVRAVCFGEYEYLAEWVTFDGYGNLQSFDNPTEHVDTEGLINAIMESPEDYDLEFEEPEEEEEESEEEPK